MLLTCIYYRLHVAFKLLVFDFAFFSSPDVVCVCVCVMVCPCREK